MTYRTHLLGGLVAGEIAIFAMTGGPDLFTPLYVMGGAALGSLMPDIDHPKSSISTFSMFTRVVSKAVTSVASHRGFFHTPLALLGLLALLFLTPLTAWQTDITMPLAIGLAVGYFSHLVLDTLNPGGIMWLWPLTKKKVHVAKIRTRSTAEWLVTIPLALLVIGGGVLYISTNIHALA